MADTRLERGIWKTPAGYRIVIRIGDRLERKRFPPTHTLDALRKWRDDHIRLRRPKKHQRGTFEEDVIAYLDAVKAMPTFQDRAHQIRAWLPAFGALPRWRITPVMIQSQLAVWRGHGKAASTVNHRRAALAHLWRLLDGKTAYNPVRETSPYPEPPPVRRGLPMPTVTKVLKKIVGEKTRARLEVLAWSGLRPSELAKLTPALVDLRRGLAYIPTTKGGPPREIPFSLAKPAWKRLLKLKALGPFSVGGARKSLHRACKKAHVTPFRIYDLRHSYLSALRASGADLSDVQAVAGHSDIRLTKRYAPTITEKLRRAVRQMHK